MTLRPIKKTCLLAALLLLVGGTCPGVLSASAGAETDDSLGEMLLERYQIELYGYAELRAGFRTDRELDEKEASLAEARLQLDLNRDFGWSIAKLKGDLVGDLVEESADAELREASLLFSPFSSLDLKLGRQTITWGTGDLLFINDLFPKDWESFFIGRDDEYLKAPSDAVKASYFTDSFNLDLVYMPIFTPSAYIDGSRLSYFNPLAGRPVGRDQLFEDDQPNRMFHDDAWALRLYRTFGSTEIALYGYTGFWSTPEGLDAVTMKGSFPKLSAYGASARSDLFGGIANLEFGYYDSRQDRDGTDPLIRNSEIRYLAGYEKELAPDLTGSVQYYVEQMLDHDSYLQNLPPFFTAKDNFRHLLTLRLTRMLLQQTLKLSLFAYYSPSDQDTYLRPKLHYKITDQWAIEGGGNLFFGNDAPTFFGQFEDNTNVYAALRRNF